MKLVIYGLMLLVSVSCTSDKNKEGKAAENKRIVCKIQSPAAVDSSLPVLFSDGENALLSWVSEQTDSTTSLNYSYLVDGAWGHPKEITRGGDWFVNWADFPMIAENDGNLISHILRKSTKETYSYDIQMNVLPKGESDWSTHMPLHTDGTKTEHGFVTALPFEKSFFVTWLDGRNTVSDGDGNGANHNEEANMTLRAAEVAFDGSVRNEVLLDDRTCSCCQTTAAITENGPVVLYRDRSEAEVRDISITRRVNGIWSPPKAICEDGWKIKGCPVNGPKAAAIDDNLAVAWFTAANDEPKVNLVFSSDGGENFDAPIVVDENEPMGRVDVLMLDGQSAVVSWMVSTGNTSELKAMRIDASGKKSEPISICKLEPSRNTGFPQMELVKDRVIFAWTEVGAKTSAIATAYVPLDTF